MDNSTKRRLSQDDLARPNLTSKTLQPSYKTSSSPDTWIKHPTISHQEYMTSDLAAQEYNKWYQLNHCNDSSWTGDAWARSFELAERDLEAYRTK